MVLNTKTKLFFVLAFVATMIGMAYLTLAQEDDYWKVVSGRAARIVQSLDLEDTDKDKRVQDIIAWQYVNLSQIHDERDKELESLKERIDLQPKDIDKASDRIRRNSDKKVKTLHKKYLKQLSSELNPEQVNMVKDGMTYGVLGNSYQAYLDLLPDLTEKQKSKIMEWLVEAREIAMDGGSSEEKHYWFGKYKGKINNYLSAEGYDLKKAEQMKR